MSVLPTIGLILTILAFALTGLGFSIAWAMDSTQGFHAIMNLLLIPMWILSGAVFPAAGAAGWIKVIMLINPMTYGIAALRTVIPSTTIAMGSEPPLVFSVTVLLVFSAVVLVVGTILVRRTGRTK